MQLMDVKTGAKVQVYKLRGGKRVGFESDIYTIKDINFNDWGVCDVLLECDGYEVFTTHDFIELASDAAIKKWEATKKAAREAETSTQEPLGYTQLTIFDFLEVS